MATKSASDTLFSKQSILEENEKIQKIQDEIVNFGDQIKLLNNKINEISQNKIGGLAKLMKIISGSNENVDDLMKELEHRTKSFRQLTASLVYRSLSLEWREATSNIKEIFSELEKIQKSPALYKSGENDIKNRYQQLTGELYKLKQRTRSITKIIREDVS
jgi:predicted  nucleic acid-binding Zn-ribbon protein